VAGLAPAAGVFKNRPFSPVPIGIVSQ